MGAHISEKNASRAQGVGVGSGAWACLNFFVTGFLLILTLPGSQLFLDQSLG